MADFDAQVRESQSQVAEAQSKIEELTSRIETARAKMICRSASQTDASTASVFSNPAGRALDRGL